MKSQLFNPYSVVAEFEKMIAKWSGAKYGVAVESCSAALFLCCLYKRVENVWIPKQTYPGVPCSIINAGGKVNFDNRKWQGVYELSPYKIYDGALRFKPKMYQGGLHCLSFHMKKNLPIGRGGMVLTNDLKAVKWFKRMRFDGRRELPLEQDTFDVVGWNMYLTPEQAIRGIQLFSTIDQRGLKDLDSTKQGYPDLSQYDVFTKSHN